MFPYVTALFTRGLFLLAFAKKAPGKTDRWSLHLEALASESAGFASGGFAKSGYAPSDSCLPSVIRST